MPLLRVAVLTVFVTLLASAQGYTISTYAGGALPVGIPGTSGSFGPTYIAADGAGNLFFAGANRILRLDAVSGLVSLVAGNGTTGLSGDNGPALNAQLFAGGLAMGAAGNLYFSDAGRVRKVSNGIVTTVAGGGSSLGDNGPATDALLNPAGIALDAAGNLYIADPVANRVRKVSGGVITTVAGAGTAGLSGDNGPAGKAQLNLPYGIALDSTGSLYIADSKNNRIRKVSNGVITTIAGNGTEGFSGDNGPASAAELDSPFSVAVDSADDLYISDSGNRRVREVKNGIIATVAGNGFGGVSADRVPAASVPLNYPAGVILDSAGNLYIADAAKIRKVAGGIITTVLGTGLPPYSGDNGPPANAQLSSPSSVALDSDGNLYIADSGENRIRKVSNGIITTVAGNGTSGFSGDSGPATNAQLYGPVGVAVDAAGNIYISEYDNRIRKVTNGIITTIAGNGDIAGGFAGDNGPAIDARLAQVAGLAVDAAGNLYIADGGNNRIRKISNGVIGTVAGNGTQGFSGDGGAATSAQLNNPRGVAVDAAGNLYIADNGRIRKVANGTITTVAGGGLGGNNNAATSAELGPVGVAVDSSGNLFLTDYNYVAEVSNGIVTLLVAGNPGFSGDNGPAISAQLNQPSGIAVDAAGNVYVADGGNGRVRLLTPGLPPIGFSPIVNAASLAIGSPVAPGSIVTVDGSFLIYTSSGVPALPLPVDFLGLSLQFGNGLKAPIFAIINNQVNFQVPWELAGLSQANLSATIQGRTSATQALNLAPFAPGIFATNSQGSGQGAILDASYRLVDSSNPAIAGSTVLQIYCTGLGPVTHQPPSGSPPGQLSETTTMPVVTIGGVQAQVLFSGLAPGSVGLYQLDVVTPAGLTGGAAVPVGIAIGGAVSNTVTIAVQ